MVLQTVPVFTTQEGRLGLHTKLLSGLGPWSLSLMTNPAGLSLIISTHNQQTHSLRYTCRDTPRWSKAPQGLKDEMIGSFVEDKLIALGEKLHCKSKHFLFFLFFLH